MGAIYRRYHEKHKQLRAERAAALQAQRDQFAEAARAERLGLGATDPAPGPTRNSPSMLPPAPPPAAAPAATDTETPAAETKADKPRTKKR